MWIIDFNKVGIGFLYMNRWANLPELRFDNARGKAQQEIPLTYDPSGTLAYQVK
jgi:hypothetical protein